MMNALLAILFLSSLLASSKAQSNFIHLGDLELEEIELTHDSSLLLVAARFGETVVVELNSPLSGAFVQEGVNLYIDCLPWLENFPNGTITWLRQGFSVDSETGEITDIFPPSSIEPFPGGRFAIGGDFNRWLNISNTNIIEGREDSDHGNYTCRVCDFETPFGECHDATITVYLPGAPPVINDTDKDVPDNVEQNGELTYRIGADFCIERGTDITFTIECEVLTRQSSGGSMPNPIPTPVRTWVKDDTAVYSSTLGLNPINDINQEFYLANRLFVPGFLFPQVFRPSFDGSITFSTRVLNSSNAGISEDVARDMLFDSFIGEWTCSADNAYGSDTATTTITECAVSTVFIHLSALELKEFEPLRHNPFLLELAARFGETVAVELNSPLSGAFVQEGVNLYIDCLPWLENFPNGTVTWLRQGFSVDSESGEITDTFPPISIEPFPGGRFAIGGDFNRWLNISNTKITQGREDADHGNYTCRVCDFESPFGECYDSTITVYLPGAPPVINDTDKDIPDNVGQSGDLTYRIGADFCIERGTDITFTIECEVLSRLSSSGSIPNPVPTPVRTWIKDDIVVYGTTQDEFINPFEDINQEFYLANRLLAPFLLTPQVFIPSSDGSITFSTRVINSSNAGIPEDVARDMLFDSFVGEWTCSADNAYGSDTATTTITECESTDFKHLSALELDEFGSLRHDSSLLEVAARIGETVVVELNSPLSGAFVQEGVNLYIDCLPWLENFPNGTVTWLRQGFSVDSESGEITDTFPPISIEPFPGGRFAIGGDFNRWLNISNTKITQGREDADHGNYTCRVCDFESPFGECYDSTITVYLPGAPPVINDTDKDIPDNVGQSGDLTYRIGADFCIERGTDITFTIECEVLIKLSSSGSIPNPIPTPVRTWIKDDIVVYNITLNKFINPFEDINQEFYLANHLLAPGLLSPQVFIPSFDGSITFSTRVLNSSNAAIPEDVARDMLFDSFIGEWTCSADNAYGSDTATTFITECGFKQLSALELNEFGPLRHDSSLLDVAARFGETAVVELNSPLSGAFVQEGVNLYIDCLPWLENFPNGTITWLRQGFLVDFQSGAITDIFPPISIEPFPGGRFAIGGDFDRWLNISNTKIIQGREDSDHGNYTCRVCDFETPFGECYDSTVTVYLPGAPPVINDADKDVVPDNVGPNGELTYRIGADFCIKRGTDITFTIECEVLTRSSGGSIPIPIPTPVRTWVKDDIVVYGATLDQFINPFEDINEEFYLANRLLVPGLLSPQVFIPSFHGSITFSTRVLNSTNAGISEDVARDMLFDSFIGEWTCSADNAYGSDTATTTITECEPEPLSFINDTPRIEGNNIIANFETRGLQSVECSLSGSFSQDCSSGTVTFSNVPLRGLRNRPYFLRLIALTSDGERIVVRRPVRPEQTGFCHAQLINGGVTVSGNCVTIEFSAVGQFETFYCSLDRGALEQCTSPKIYRGLSNGLHRVKVVPSTRECASDRYSDVFTFTVV